MKKLLLFILVLLPNLACAYTLEVVQGITIYTINGKKVASQFSDHYQILEGKNQIAVNFDGKLKSQGKKEHFQSKPYLLTFDATDDIKLSTVSKKHKAIVQLIRQGMPIFEADIKTINIEQKQLPAISKTLPYANIPNLVSSYNEKNGIYFSDNGSMEKLSAVKLKTQQKTKESKIIAQLKYWYSKATIEELNAFEVWKNRIKK